MNADAEATVAVALHASGLSSFCYCVEEMDAAAHLAAADAAVAVVAAAVAVLATAAIAVCGLSFFFSSVVAMAVS